MSDYYVNLTTYVGVGIRLVDDVTGWVENGWIEIRQAFTEMGTNVILGSGTKFVDEYGRVIIRLVTNNKSGVHRMVRLITVIHNWVRRGR